MFEYFSHENGTPCVLFRLFYAVDLRYGVLVDVARKVHAGEPVDLTVGRLLAGRHCLDPNEDLSPGQEAEIDRVLRSHPHLTDDAFVAENLERWLG